MADTRQHLLVFGASGAIGSAICSMAAAKGWAVTGVARSLPDVPLQGVKHVALNPLDKGFGAQSFSGLGPFTAVCWSQGMNATDSVYNVERETALNLFEANCLYILESLKVLLNSASLSHGSRLCVISSIWQNIARQNKLSYCMTKAAVEGLVLSASADLAADGHLINAVMPGAVDTPMTRANLKPEQLDRLAGGTQFNRLASLDDVASTVCWLCSPENTGITGQFIAVDLGWSRVRIV